MVACSGYKFVGACVNLLTFMVLGTTPYYSSLLYNAMASAFFTREVLRVAWLATPASPVAGKYFRLVVMASQFVWALILSVA